MKPHRRDAVPQLKGGARTSARFCAVQGLYTVEIRRAPLNSVLEGAALLAADSEAVGATIAHVAPDTALLTNLLAGTVRNAAAIDAALTKALPPHRSLARLEAPLRALLRVAVCEQLFLPDPPAAGILLREYAVLAGVFAGEGVPALVANVLQQTEQQTGLLTTEDRAATNESTVDRATSSAG